jgi:hypothetical protein
MWVSYQEFLGWLIQFNSSILKLPLNLHQVGCTNFWTLGLQGLKGPYSPIHTNAICSKVGIDVNLMPMTYYLNISITPMFKWMMGHCKLPLTSFPNYLSMAIHTCNTNYFIIHFISYVSHVHLMHNFWKVDFQHLNN